MSEAEFIAYRQRVEADTAKLAQLLERLGSPGDEQQFPLRQDGPLAELYVGIHRAAKRLASVVRDLEQRVASTERTTRELRAQSETIRALSTPVLRVWDEVLILPLVGVVDTRRAQQITVNLLQAIVEDQATVAIIDVTGVPVVDTTVADHLLRTIQAARMIGAEVILTGVSPENAMTLVKLGIDLSEVTTKGSLETGLRYALELIDTASDPNPRSPTAPQLDPV